VTAANLGKILQEKVTLDSHLMTDSAPVYALSRIGKAFARHGMTDHSTGEYAKPDGTHSNTVESAFSLLKRGIDGTFYNVRRKHLHRYVAEFDFGWNARKVETANDWHVRFGARRVSDCAIVSQLPSCRRGRCKGDHFESRKGRLCGKAT
jgi:hypothetical protein